MRKLINFIKKPLTIISAFLFLISTIGLIVVSTVKHGKTYVCDIDDSASEIIVTFEDDDTLVVESFVSFSESETVEFEYKINKGKLLVKDDDDWAYIGKVTSFELVMDYENPVTGKVTAMEFECDTNETIQEVCVALMVAFGIVFVCSLAVAVLDKFGLLKALENLGKSKTNAETNAVESTEKQANENEISDKKETK